MYSSIINNVWLGLSLFFFFFFCGNKRIELPHILKPNNVDYCVNQWISESFVRKFISCLKNYNFCVDIKLTLFEPSLMIFKEKRFEKNHTRKKKGTI
jgi:hypothetical protein